MRKIRGGEKAKEKVEGEKQKQKTHWWVRTNVGAAEGSREAVNSDPSIETKNDVLSSAPPSNTTSATAADAPCADPPIADNLSETDDPTHSQEVVPSDPISYWDMAAERLREEKLEVYKAFEEIRKDIPREEGVLAATMMDVVNKHKETMEERQWSLPFKVRGREVKIREQLDGVLKAVRVFKDFGSGLAALDPVHAGIPWAAVNLVLQVALNDSEQTEAALEGLSEISLIISRYTEVEAIYLMNKDTTSLKKDFEECLINLYMNVLEYQVVTACHCKSNTFNRQIRDKKLHDIIEEQDRKMDRKMEEIRRNLQLVANESKRRENQDLLNWICNVDPLPDHKRILEGAKLGSDYAGSGQWLFDHPAFLNWSSSDSGAILAFWLHGPVGSGKSSLVSRVIEWHLGRAMANGNEQVAYFYCSKRQGQLEGSEPKCILQSLVRQLAWSPQDSTIANPIKVAWNNGKRSKEDKLSLNDCSKILSELSTRCRRTTIILDALDECADPIELLQHLKSLSGKKNVTLSLFVSSRNEVEVSKVLENCPTINLESNNTSKDIEYFIRHEVEDKPPYARLLSGRFPELEAKLIDVLYCRAQGSFQWVTLQLAIFYPKHPSINPDDVKAKLKRLDSEVGIPKLNTVYDEIYETNTRDGAKIKEDAMRAFKFVLCSQGPLKATELAEAVSIDPDGSSRSYVDRDYVLQICSNLIIVEERDVVQLAHLSVREYLQNSPRFTDTYSDLQAHTQAAESCLAYLTHSYTKFSETYFNGGGFGGYAILYWPFHCEGAGENRRKESSLRKLFTNLLLSEEVGEAYIEWIKALLNPSTSRYLSYSESSRLMDAISSPPSALFAACVWGFSEVISDASGKGSASLAESNANNLQCLHIASKHGHEAVVRLLLEHKTDVNVKDRDVRYVLEHGGTMRVDDVTGRL
ncbi:hypothetical protein G7Y89_g13014 [Cudoniella acicularis]|uniref:NACHT domain-containing protein n=1 Tax=Cudoniella acicularis TaxID=354080 RepID=A0A8H4VWF7_9HELO|nr:hypothetical protein G7Y89_g13014 [Cudoniella acicularis]